MGIFSRKYRGKNISEQAYSDIRRMIDELLRIGKNEDFLSLRPGGAFDQNCRHIRAREIGKSLGEMGGVDLMRYVFSALEKKLGRKHSDLAEHLGYCWNHLAEWKY